MAALSARFGAHFDDPVGLLQNLRVVVDQDDGVAVGDEIVHHAGKPHDIRRVQTDRRLIEHIQHACRAVPHRPRKLHALPFPG